MPPADSVEPEREGAEDERELIRRTLVSLIDERGYSKTTLEDLLGRARIDRPIFERSFQTLDECFAEVWRDFTQEIAGQVLIVYAEADNWRDGIPAQAWALCRLTIEDELRARICMFEVNFGGELVQATRDIVMGGGTSNWSHPGRHETDRGADVPKAKAEAAVGAIWERVARHISAGRLDSLVDDIPGLLYSGAPATLNSEIASAVENCAADLERLGHGIETVKAPYGLWPGISLMPRAKGDVRSWRRRAPSAQRSPADSASPPVKGAAASADTGRTFRRTTCSAGHGSTSPLASLKPACRSAPSCSVRPTARSS